MELRFRSNKVRIPNFLYLKKEQRGLYRLLKDYFYKVD